MRVDVTATKVALTARDHPAQVGRRRAVAGCAVLRVPAHANGRSDRSDDAAGSTVAFSVVVAGSLLLLRWLTDDGFLGPFLAGSALAALSVLHDEWVHLLVHTRHRSRSRSDARLARNHRLHRVRHAGRRIAKHGMNSLRRVFDPLTE